MPDRTQSPYRFLFFLLLVLGMACPRAHAAVLWEQPPTVGSGLGVHIKGWLIDDNELARLKRMGVTFVRFSLGWGGIERTQTVYDWRESDALIQRVRAQGLKMVIPMLGGNAAYDGSLAAPQPNTDRVQTRPYAPLTPESQQAYARFVAQAVVRYGTADIVWEIWNEPDLARFWPPRPDAQAFSVLADVTCTMVRHVAKEATIVGPALGRVPDVRDKVSPDYFETFLASGAVKCLDAITVHPYRHGPEVPEAAFADYATLFGLMAKHKNYLPLLNTEWGYTTTQVTPETQAAYALRARLTDMIWGVPLSVWYEWKDSRDDPDDLEGHFGLVTLDGVDKPALTHAEALWTLLQNFKLDQQIATTNAQDILLLMRGPSGTKALIGWTLRPQESLATASFTKDGETAQGVLTSLPTLLAQGQTIDSITVHDTPQAPHDP